MNMPNLRDFVERNALKRFESEKERGPSWNWDSKIKKEDWNTVHTDVKEM